MKLDSLTLRNFKGIKYFKLIAGCQDARIFGENGTGKTTLMDARDWLLWDKDSLGQSQFEIKTLEDGQPIHNLEHEVEGVFVNGETITLKKVYQEKWTSRRGKAKTEKEFDGHKTDHFIDGVPVTKTEYKKKVTEMFTDEHNFKLLSNPTYFTSLPWTKQRDSLLGLLGDITDEQVIASQPDLAELPAILGKHTCDEYKKIITARRKKINEEIQSIPARIDEQDRSKPELAVTNPEAIVSNLTTLRSMMAKKNEEIASIKSGGGAAEKVAQIKDLENQLRDLINKRNAEVDERSSVQRRKVRELENEVDELSAEIARLDKSIDGKKSDIAILTQKNNGLRDEYKEIIEEAFTVDTECPTCSQTLPANQVEEAKAKLNLLKSQKLEKINEKGIANKGQIGVLEKAITELQGNLDSTKTLLEKRRGELEQQAQTLSAIADELAIKPEGVAEIEAQIAALSKEVQDISAGNSDLVTKAAEEAKAIENEIAENEKNIALIEQVHRADDRIAELKKQEKTLAEEFEKIEGELFLIESFIRAKVSMLEERINDHFEIVSFRLFKEQVNEGLQEVCEATVNGVPFGSLNSAARIQAGLDIIRTFSRHYNFAPVVFIDAAESITDIPEMDCQVITLTVSKGDDALRVEAAE